MEPTSQLTGKYGNSASEGILHLVELEAKRQIFFLLGFGETAAVDIADALDTSLERAFCPGSESLVWNLKAYTRILGGNLVVASLVSKYGINLCKLEEPIILLLKACSLTSS